MGDARVQAPPLLPTVRAKRSEGSSLGTQELYTRRRPLAMMVSSRALLSGIEPSCKSGHHPSSLFDFATLARVEPDWDSEYGMVDLNAFVDS